MSLDAIGLQGVFFQYPQLAASGRNMAAAGVLLQMLRRKPNFSKWSNWEDVPERQRERLLLRTVKKITQMDDDDEFLLLTI